MESSWLPGFLKLLVACIFLICCDGANVQLFKDENFQGEMHETTSSSTCQSLPSSVQSSGSVISSDCIAMFNKDGCIANTNCDYVVRTKSKKRGCRSKSYRDCKDLERGPQVNLDYYAEVRRTGKKVEYRDICGCANLPIFKTARQSINTYGNHFIFYGEADCRGSTEIYTQEQRYTYWHPSSQRSVIPVEIPRHCSDTFNVTAEIVKIEQITDISNLDDFVHQVPTSDKEIFYNNDTAPQENQFESTKQITQIGQFEFPTELNQISSISINTNFESSIPFITLAWRGLKNGFSEVYNHRENPNELLSLSLPVIELTIFRKR